MFKMTYSNAFKKLLEDEEFKKKYYLFFLDRFVYQTADIEGNLSEEKRKKTILNLLEGFNSLIDNNSPRMSPYDIIDLANIVNKESGIEGIRKTHVDPGEFAKWEAINASDILPALYSLVNNYTRVWDIRETYEREAAFHIELMRIHPFEDGNKRTAKLLTNANLIKQGFPPVIINEDETEEYYNFINNRDDVGFAEFLRKKSKQELISLISLYKLTYNVPVENELIGGQIGGLKSK